MNVKGGLLTICFSLTIAFLISCAGSSAFARSLCVDLTESNRLPDGKEYAAVTLSYIYDGDKRGVRITVKENEDLLAPRKYFGIRRFGFNTTLANPAQNLRVKVPREWTRRFKRLSYGTFGQFEVNISRRVPSLAKIYKRVTPLIIDIYYRSGDVSYNDFIVENKKGYNFAALIANYTYDEKYYPGACFATEEKPMNCEKPSTTTTIIKPYTTTTTGPASTSTVNPSSTTTSKPVSTSTVKPSSTTTSKPATTTTVKPPTTSTVLSTTTSVLTTTSSQPVSTTTAPNTTTSQRVTTTSLPTTTSSQLTTTTSMIPICNGEIYKGGTCDLGLPIDDPAYNRPGRRGLSLTCEDIVDFCVCTDCVNLDPVCLVWSIEPAEPYLSIVTNPNGTARLTVGESCDQLEAIREYKVTVTDTCNGWSDSVALELGKVTIDVQNVSAGRGAGSFEVPVSLINKDNSVKALMVDICECDGGDDKMACDSCVIDPDRALDFNCSAHEMDNGCCRVVLYSTDPAALIFEGTGPVFNIIYEADETCEGCTCLRPVNRKISDRFNEELCACQSPGDVCFKSCGDIFPQDCLDPGCAACGDDVVNLFDILEAVDIVLGYQTPTACQLAHGDVPNGKPPYCGEPAGTLNCSSDGDIDVLDLLVIIDMAQGRANCCDFCLFKRIF